MVDPHNQRFEPVTTEMAESFKKPADEVTPEQRAKREWTRFEEGERVSIKGVLFYIHEIGETRLVLKLVKH